MTNVHLFQTIRDLHLGAHDLERSVRGRLDYVVEGLARLAEELRVERTDEDRRSSWAQAEAATRSSASRVAKAASEAAERKSRAEVLARDDDNVWPPRVDPPIGEADIDAMIHICFDLSEGEWWGSVRGRGLDMVRIRSSSACETLIHMANHLDARAGELRTRGVTCPARMAGVDAHRKPVF